MLQQVVDQLGVLDHRANGFEAAAVKPLAIDGEAVHHDLLDLLALDLLDELGVAHLFGRALHVEIIEYRQQDRGNHQP